MSHYVVIYSGSTPMEFRDEVSKHGNFRMIRLGEDLWRLEGECTISQTRELELVLLMTPHVTHFHRTSGPSAGLSSFGEVPGSLMAFEDLGTTNTWSTEEDSEEGEFDDFINDEVDASGFRPADVPESAQDPNWMDAFPVSASPEAPSFTSPEWQSAARQAAQLSRDLDQGWRGSAHCSCTVASSVPGCSFPHCPGVASMDQ